MKYICSKCHKDFIIDKLNYLCHECGKTGLSITTLMGFWDLSMTK